MANSKILIIPDVHGRSFWRIAKRHIDDYEHIVFLGDYLDPYEDEFIDIDLAFLQFAEIMNLKVKNPDKVTLLLGNHDLHYYWPIYWGCRRCEEYLNILNTIYQTSREWFSIVYERVINGKKFIFSHAGITKEWLDDNGLEYNPDYLNSLLDNNSYGILQQVSFARGGDDDFGSPVWADVSEHMTSEGIPNVYQIFGHTQQEKDPVITSEWACLDCRRPFELSLETGRLSEVTCEDSSLGITKCPF